MSDPSASARASAGPLQLVLPAGALLLVVAMAITIAGIPVPGLFRPGTWFILIAMLVTAAGGILRIVHSADGG